MLTWTRENIYKRDGFRCVYCGHDGSTFEGWRFLTIDHFVPLSKGGTVDESNLVTSCVACNNQKFNCVFTDMDEAKAKMNAVLAGEIRAYWQKNVAPLVTSR
jgi:5-methylcytosine-specific restriction endonuclease McrA